MELFAGTAYEFKERLTVLARLVDFPLKQLANQIRWLRRIHAVQIDGT